MSWAAFVGAGVGIWAKRALVGLGVGVVSFAGLTALKGQLDSLMASQIGTIPADAYSILSLAGFIDVVNIWLAAFGIVVAMSVGKRFGIL